MLPGMNDFDVVMPRNNEKEFIDTAIALGYKEIVFLVNDINYECIKTRDINIRTAYLLKNSSELRHARKKFDLVFANADRRFFEQKPDYIINCELSQKRDSFHYRNTSLNQVHAKLARGNNINIVFSFSLLLNNGWAMKQVMLGRMLQNAQIVRKYKLKNSVFSMAVAPKEMRSRVILDALAKVLG